MFICLKKRFIIRKKEKSKKRSVSSSDSEEDLTMFKEAAVDSNIILESSAIEEHKNEFLINKTKNFKCK